MIISYLEVDTYVNDLNIQTWNLNRSTCQFQGEGSSHELASLLVTECIQQSLHQLKLPMYVLFLDAESAFDVVPKELVIENLFYALTKQPPEFCQSYQGQWSQY